MASTAVQNKRFGFAAEADLLQFLRDNGYSTERLHLTGTEDEGDLLVTGYLGVADVPVLIQLKTFSSRSKAGAERPLTPGKLKGWLRDLDNQREAYRAHRSLALQPKGMLVVKFKNTSWEDALVIDSLGRWLG